MELAEGKNVVYRTEICRVEGCETKCADGVNPRQYCVLAPVNSRSARYYIPVETAPGKLRELLTKDEILDLIKNGKVLM